MIKPKIVNKLKSINELQLLEQLSRVEEWEHNKLTRVVTAESLGIAEITLKKNLKRLLEIGFIEKISKGVYRINKEVIQ